MRRLILSVSLAYLLVAFGFIILTMLNTSTQGSLVIMGEADAGVIVAMSALGIAVTLLLALRVLIDGKHRRDLERQVHEPRRRSDRTGTPDRMA